MRASSYLPLPKELKAKQGCLNIQKNDSKCQEYEHKLSMFGIQYPADIKDIGKFQQENNISVNVYGYKDKKIFLLGITTMNFARHHVNLLCITAGEKSHYVLVKDLSRLVLIQYNNDNNKRYFCQYC